VVEAAERQEGYLSEAAGDAGEADADELELQRAGHGGEQEGHHAGGGAEDDARAVRDEVREEWSTHRDLLQVNAFSRERADGTSRLGTMLQSRTAPLAPADVPLNAPPLLRWQCERYLQ
jgi:hypothetical protein